jgi:hypothetical protein
MIGTTEQSPVVELVSVDECDGYPFLRVEASEGRRIDVRLDDVQAIERVPTGAVASGSHATDPDPKWLRQTVIWLSSGARIMLGITSQKFHDRIVAKFTGGYPEAEE